MVLRCFFAVPTASVGHLFPYVSNYRANVRPYSSGIMSSSVSCAMSMRMNMESG